MKYTLWLWILGLLINSTQQLNAAQKTQFVSFSEASQLTIAEGLPSNTVFSLIQDDLGFIWTGTPSGIGLLNGYKAEKFEHPNIPELALMSPGNVYLDNEGTLWVGTWGNGVKAINNNRNQLLNLDWTEAVIAEERVQTFYQASDNALWIGTFDNGLFRLNRDTESLTSWQFQGDNIGLSHNRIWSITQDTTGNMWIGTSNGLNKLDAETGQFTSYYNSRELSVADKLIRTIHIQDDQVWFGTNLGLFNMDMASGNIKKVMPPEIDILSINKIIQKGNTLWIATFSGLFYFDLTTQKFKQFSAENYAYLPQKDIRDLMITSREVLLLATRYSGVYKLNLRPKPFRQINNQHYVDLNKMQIWEMARDRDGFIWAGTNDGVIKFSLEQESTVHVPAVVENAVQGLTLSVAFSQDKSYLWIGTVNQLFRYDMQSGELLSFNQRLGISQLNHIRLFVDNDDCLWVNSAHQGILRVTAQGDVSHYHTNAPPPFTIPDNNIAQLTQSHDGQIWMVSGNNHLLHKSESENRFSQLTLKLPEQDKNVNLIATSLHVARNNQIYIGTYSGLLEIQPETGETRRLTISDGLANNEIRGISSDWPGNVWVTTGTGITRISNNGNDYHSFGTIDGLSSLSMNLRSILNCTDDIMCFGSSNGVNFVQEANQWQRNSNENIIISNLWINQEKQSYPSTGADYLNLMLQSNERNLKFQFGKIDHRPGANHELYFRLQGFDERWFSSDVSRIANYTNLQPGSYVFDVTDSPTQYQLHNSARVIIEIIPPFWSRTWVQVAAVFLTLSLLTLGYRTRIKQIRSNEQKLNKLVTVRTQNMALLGDIGMEITRSLNLEEIFYNLQKHLKSILAEHEFSLGLLNEEKNALKFDLIIGNANLQRGVTISLAEQPNMCVQCFKHVSEIVINDDDAAQKLREDGMNTDALDGYQSGACIPLQINGTAIGVIFVRSHNENAYGEYERQFLRTISAYTAVALKNARYYQEQKHTHEKRITWLENITHYLNHEMKNSILGAQTSLNMLHRKIRNSELQKYVDRAEKSHKEMRSIMKAVSETTSLEASIMQTSSIEFDVSEVIQNRLEDYAVIYPDANIEGQVTPFIFIKGNDNLIVQCLDKLVNNAIEHYAENTAITVLVELKDSNCVVTVTNIGDELPGNTDDIFKLFTSSKADSSSGNFGMGLYVSRLIADFHHGQISARPLNDGLLQGATFELRIPIE